MEYLTLKLCCRESEALNPKLLPALLNLDTASQFLNVDWLRLQMYPTDRSLPQTRIHGRLCTLDPITSIHLKWSLGKWKLGTFY